ncbi:GNAT family N-acetyltransferase [Rossellomorea oryzaecorticis]|uniref:GNAT family N-acetyltransferase n=1 Tax=Rossellomorea oryzaecorticis TaxID=1396505 RepID=A0ABW8VU57_9BACI
MREHTYTIRPAKLEDLPTIFQLFLEYEEKVYGERQTSELEVREILTTIDENDRKALWKDGKLAGFSLLTVKDHRLPSLLMVYPEEEMGVIMNELLKELVHSAVSKKENERDERVIVLSANLETESKTLEDYGFTPVRHWFQMNMDLTDYTVKFPDKEDGPVLSTFSLDETEMLHELFEEVFSDHFDYHPTSLEDFKKRFQRELFDPSLWFLLKKENEPIGFIMCTVNDESGLGEITHLGVRKDCRNRGYATILLHHAFTILKERGMNTAALSVDSESLTDATIVYQKAGMHVHRSFTRMDFTV